jgi:dTDP-4-dehydrorhamnose 3,5-epimerase
LNSNEQIALWVPEGFAHGFQALEDGTRVHYKVTNYWNKESERALLFSDPELKINWRSGEYKVSEKDLEARPFKEIQN